MLERPRRPFFAINWQPIFTLTPALLAKLVWCHALLQCALRKWQQLTRLEPLVVMAKTKAPTVSDRGWILQFISLAFLLATVLQD